MRNIRDMKQQDVFQTLEQLLVQQDTMNMSCPLLQELIVYLLEHLPCGVLVYAMKRLQQQQFFETPLANLLVDSKNTDRK